MKSSARLITYQRALDGLKLLALTALPGVSGCSDSNPASETDSTNTGTESVDGEVSTNSPTGMADDTMALSTQARYRLTFNALWSETTHPLNFPANPHFSGLVGAVHNEQVIFWQPAQIASAGIQRMAETGGKSDLLSEVQTAIDAGFALASINGGGIGTSPGTASIEFEVNRHYPEISLTSMLAPSPDWFVGVHNYSLLSDGEFIESATIELKLYDSGSDNGVRYTSANEATEPLAPIATVLSGPQDAPFTNGTPGVGSFVIERLSVE